MRLPSRKIHRFHVINPKTDRRHEQRFESQEDVLVRFEHTGRSFPGVAYDIGKKGLKLESNIPLESGMNLQVTFPKALGHVRAFGRVIWAHPIPNHTSFESGLSLDVWYGIIEGEHSWKTYKGHKPRKDRRLTSR